MSFEAKMALVVTGAFVLTLASNANVFRGEPVASAATTSRAPVASREAIVTRPGAAPQRRVATFSYASRAEALAGLARWQRRVDPAVRLDRFKVEAEGRDLAGRGHHAATPWIDADDRFDATDLLARAGGEPIKVAITAEYTPVERPVPEPDTWVLVSAGLLLIAAVSYRRSGNAAAF